MANPLLAFSAYSVDLLVFESLSEFRCASRLMPVFTNLPLDDFDNVPYATECRYQLVRPHVACWG